MKKTRQGTQRYNRQDKNKAKPNQLKTIFHYLQKYTATASMVTESTGVPQKCFTRYKRNLEKSGRLWEVEKKICKETGFKAWYLTTNPDKAPFNNQLKMSLL
jgi:hypothetical protein